MFFKSIILSIFTHKYFVEFIRMSQLLTNFLRNHLIGNPSAFIQVVKRKNAKTKTFNWSWITKYQRITKDLLSQHIAGKVSIGSFPVYYKWKTVYCKFIGIDIDFHLELKKDGKIIHTIDENLKQKAKEKIDYVILHSQKFFKLPPKNIFVEDSGGGFHIWIPLKKDTTLLNATLYINYIQPHLQQQFMGIDDSLEFFPKQSAEELKLADGTIDLQKKPGNAIRLPFGLNKKRNHESKIIIGDVTRFLPANIMPITKALKYTISRIKTKKMTQNIPDSKLDSKDKRKKVRDEGIKFYYEHSAFRSCFKACIDGSFQMDGSNGNIMRVGLSNELYSMGAKKVTIAQAFANQKDFNYDTTMSKIDDCIKYVNYYKTPLTLRCKTIKQLGYCVDTCPKLGGTTNIISSQDKKLPSLKGWDGLYDMMDEVIKERNKRYYIYKTTRSGTTTAVIIKSLQRKKKILMIAPLINIFKITVNDALIIGKEIKMLDQERDYKIHRVKSNFELCEKIKNRFKDVENIEKVFPFFYKGYCKKCKTKDNCEFQEFLITLEEKDLIYLTVRKFNAMIKGGEDGITLLRRLLNWADVIFVDECSHIFDVEWDSRTIWIDNRSTVKNYLDEWKNALDNFCMTYPAWNQTDQIICLTNFIKDLQKKIDEIKFYNQSYFESMPNEYYEQLDTNKQIAFYLQLIEYYKETKDHSVSYLIDCFLNMSRKEIYFQLLLPLRDPKKIILATVSNIRNTVEYLNHFTKDKLLLLTDATEPPIDLNKCFDDLEYLYVNDPNNTAIKQKVYVIPGSLEFFKLTNGLKQEIIEVLDQYAHQKENPVFLVAQSKRILGFLLSTLRDQSLEIKTDFQIKMVDYFRGKHTKGQPSPYRRMVVFGTPRPPAHCYDFVADIYRKAGYLKQYQTSELAGKYLENYSAQSSFFQAISRVKDPAGIKDSLVIVYGCKQFEVLNWLDMKINTPDVILL